MKDSLASLLQPGDQLIAGQTLGEPTALLAALFSSAAGIDDLSLFTGMSLTGVFADAPPGMELTTFVGLGTSGRLIAEGRMRLIPCHMSELAWSLREGPLRPDVALILVSPPDTDGMCSLGVTSDYIWNAVNHARLVLAEVNSQVPRVAGDTAIPFERIDGLVESDRPLPEQPRVAPSAEERVIGSLVAEHIGDGTCIQIGVGRLGEAVLQAVADRRDLGVHAGMVGDTVLEMARDGVITNARKKIDTGLTVAGSILGSSQALSLARSDPSLRICSIDHTHNPEVMAQLTDVVCVNSAIEVDLLGQVNSEVAGGRYVGAIGGAVDFLRGSVRSGGRSIVAFPATAKGGTVSKIVPTVQRVTALRADVDVVVTEHGQAELRGVTEGERVARLIGIAAPEHREQLRDSARQMGL
jgi:acetyl-CoA hydrolase